MKSVFRTESRAAINDFSRRFKLQTKETKSLIESFESGQMLLTESKESINEKLKNASKRDIEAFVDSNNNRSAVLGKVYDQHDHLDHLQDGNLNKRQISADFDIDVAIKLLANETSLRTLNRIFTDNASNIETLVSQINLPIYRFNILIPNMMNIIEDYRNKNPISVNDNSHLKSWRSSWTTHKNDTRFLELINSTTEVLTKINSDCFDQNLKYTCHELWVAQYDIGNYAERHYHYPLDWSVVYYVNVEKESSPIIFGEDVEVYPEKDMMLIFPGWLNHRVPPTKGKRTVIAMNFFRL